MFLKVSREERNQILNHYIPEYSRIVENTDVMIQMEVIASEELSSYPIYVEIPLQGNGTKTKIIKAGLQRSEVNWEPILAKTNTNDVNDALNKILKDKFLRGSLYTEIAPAILNELNSVCRLIRCDTIDADSKTIKKFIIPESEGIEEYLSSLLAISGYVNPHELIRILSSIGDMVGYIRIGVPYSSIERIGTYEADKVLGYTMSVGESSDNAYARMEFVHIKIDEDAPTFVITNGVPSTVSLSDLVSNAGSILMQERRLRKEDKQIRVPNGFMETINKKMEGYLETMQEEINKRVGSDPTGELAEQLAVGEIPAGMEEDIILKLENSMQEIQKEMAVMGTTTRKMETVSVAAGYSVLESFIANSKTTLNSLT